MNELDELRREAEALLRSAPVDDFAALDRRATRGGGATPGEGGAPALPGKASAALLDLRLGAFTDRAQDWAVGFLETFFAEIRGAICEGKAAAVEGLTAKGAASAISGWAVGALGISNPIAFGIATLVVLVLGGALRSAFCAMTREEVLAGLAKAAPRSAADRA